MEPVITCRVCKKELGYIMNDDPSSYISCRVWCPFCYTGEPVKPTTSKPIKKKNGYRPYSKAVAGIRPDVNLDYRFRSTIEANFARVLNYLTVLWQYENRVFIFSGYKIKPHKYIMDFEVSETNPWAIKHGITAGYYEVKGRLDGNTKRKFKRLKSDYPSDFAKTKVILYSKVQKNIDFLQDLGYSYLLYPDLIKTFSSIIPGWEMGKSATISFAD